MGLKYAKSLQRKVRPFRAVFCVLPRSLCKKRVQGQNITRPDQRVYWMPETQNRLIIKG